MSFIEIDFKGDKIFIKGKFTNTKTGVHNLTLIQTYCLSKIDYYKGFDLFLKGCTQITPTAILVLGTLKQILNDLGIRLSMVIKDAPLHIIKHLLDSGLVTYYNPTMPLTSKKTIPMQRIQNEDHIVMTVEQILNLAPIKLREDARAYLLSKFYEVFANAFTHSGCNGVYCCGEWIPARQKMIFCIYDDGHGIPNNIRKYLGNDSIKASNTIEWCSFAKIASKILI